MSLFIVLAYGLAAFACFRAMQRTHLGALGWALLVIAFGALAVDHMFGLLDLAAGFLRGVAEQQHWYADRRPLQRDVILGVALFGAVALPILLVALRRQIWQLRIAALAALGLMALAVIRSISLHSIDALFARPLWRGVPLELGGTIELAGIAMAVLACLTVPHRRSRVRGGRGKGARRTGARSKRASRRNSAMLRLSRH